jgi:hypothetical protein
MQYNKDRRYARHGSGIISPTESIGDLLSRPSIYETVVVADFISDPIDFLSEKIEIVDLSNHSIVGKGLKNNLSEKINNFKEQIRRDNIFNKKQEEDETKITKSVTRLEAYTSEESPEKVENSDLVSVMPRNSIIGTNISKSNIKSGTLEIFFPFFSSHLCLPVKPGEHVWCFYDNVGGKKIGYWISRKISFLPVEDVNYTHNDRNNAITEAIHTVNSKKSSQKEKKKRLQTIFNKFSNSPSSTDGKSTTIKNRDYDDIIINSKSYNEEFEGQAVPRYNKKCSDLVLQGSNNTVIAMTHSGEEYSGNIVIAAGRPTIPSSLIKNIRSLKAKNYEYEEEDKSEDVITNENLEQLQANNLVKNIQHNDIELAASYLMVKETGSINLKSDEIHSMAEHFNILATDTSIRGSNTEILCDKIMMNDADEPYVIHSALESILDKIIADIASLNATMFEISLLAGTAGVAADATGLAAQVGFAALATATTSVPIIIDNAVTAPDMERLFSKTIFGSK